MISDPSEYFEFWVHKIGVNLATSHSLSDFGHAHLCKDLVHCIPEGMQIYIYYWTWQSVSGKKKSIKWRVDDLKLRKMMKCKLNLKNKKKKAWKKKYP